jgi:hypothetical protein
MVPKTPQYFMYMFPMFEQVVGIDEYIIEVHDDTYIKHISKDIIHKMLKDHGTIGQAEQHDLPFKRAIMGSECCFPLIAFGDSDLMECMPEVDLV